MDHAMEHSTNGSGHEHREANLALIIWGAIGLGVATLILMLIVWGMFNALKVTEVRHEELVSPLATPGAFPPEPRLQVKPYEELQRLHAHENEILSSYGWQDQKSGIVHIPIDKAMDLVAQRGPYGGKLAPPTQPGKAGAPAAKAGKQ